MNPLACGSDQMDLGAHSTNQEVSRQLEAASTRVRSMLPLESTVHPDVVAWVRSNPLYQQAGWSALAPHPTSVGVSGVSLSTGTASLHLDVQWLGASHSVRFDITLERLEDQLEDVVHDSLASLLPECMVDDDCEGVNLKRCVNLEEITK